MNGKVVSGASNCVPRRGYLCLEAEGSECHFRNLRIQELPSSHPPASEIATADDGFKSLYTGVDLSGWKVEPGHVGHWQAKDWMLDYDGHCTAMNRMLCSTKDYGDFVLMVDWRFTRQPKPRMGPEILPDGNYATNKDGTPKLVEIHSTGAIVLRGRSKAKADEGWTEMPLGAGIRMWWVGPPNFPHLVSVPVSQINVAQIRPVQPRQPRVRHHPRRPRATCWGTEFVQPIHAVSDPGRGEDRMDAVSRRRTRPFAA